MLVIPEWLEKMQVMNLKLSLVMDKKVDLWNTNGPD